MRNDKGARRVLSLLSIVVAFGTACPVIAQDSSPGDAIREAFVQANTLYEKGDYEGAIERYVGLVNSGLVNEDLYFNLANAYYKIDELGEAVLFYERALRLAPRYVDARENLALVRSQLRDKQFVRDRNRFVGALVWFHDNLNTNEMILLVSLCYLGLCLLGIVFVFRESRVVSAVYRAVSIVSPGRLAGLTKSQDILAASLIVGFLFLSTGFSAYQKIETELRREVGVVLETEVPVFSSPTEDSTLQFKIHEGTMVTIREHRLRRVRIRLPGGLSGWVSVDSVGWV